MPWRPSDWEELKRKAMEDYYKAPVHGGSYLLEIGFNLATYCYRRAGSANPPGQVPGRWVFIKDDEEETK